MTIDSIGPRLSSFNGINPITPGLPKVSAPNANPGRSFGDFLSEAVGEVNELQVSADKKVEDLVLKREEVNPHTAMIALEKADVAFQLMNAVKGKIVRAYEEIMRTQV